MHMCMCIYIYIYIYIIVLAGRERRHALQLGVVCKEPNNCVYIDMYIYIYIYTCILIIVIIQWCNTE